MGCENPEPKASTLVSVEEDVLITVSLGVGGVQPAKKRTADAMMSRFFMSLRWVMRWSDKRILAAAREGRVKRR